MICPGGTSSTWDGVKLIHFNGDTCYHKPGKKPARTFRLWTQVLSWYDADTYYGIVDQGFGDYKGTFDKPIRVRCALIQAPDDAPEQLQAQALELANRLAPWGWYECTSYKPDPDVFGRPLLDLHLPDGSKFSTRMLESGLAVPYKK